jgi:hypothetical protein
VNLEDSTILASGEQSNKTYLQPLKYEKKTSRNGSRQSKYRDVDETDVLALKPYKANPVNIKLPAPEYNIGHHKRSVTVEPLRKTNIQTAMGFAYKYT